MQKIGCTAWPGKAVALVSTVALAGLTWTAAALDRLHPAATAEARPQNGLRAAAWVQHALLQPQSCAILGQRANKAMAPVSTAACLHRCKGVSCWHHYALPCFNLFIMTTIVPTRNIPLHRMRQPVSAGWHVDRQAGGQGGRQRKQQKQCGRCIRMNIRTSHARWCGGACGQW